MTTENRPIHTGKPTSKRSGIRFDGAHSLKPPRHATVLNADIVTNECEPTNLGSVLPTSPQTIESELAQRLRNDLEIEISSLVVQRLPNGVCLQGVVELDDPTEEPDSQNQKIDDLARQVAGVDRIVNQLVFRTTTDPST